MSTIESSTSLAGQLLISMPNLVDAYFHGTVILICEHTDEGAMGFVINKPTQVPLSTVFQQMKLEYDEDVAKQPILAGGPVALERGFLIHEDDGREWQSGFSIGDGLRLTASLDAIKSLATGAGPEPALLVTGYAGWTAGQLETEIADNVWFNTPVTHKLLFETPYENRLEEAAASIGVDLNRMSSDAGHA